MQWVAVPTWRNLVMFFTHKKWHSWIFWHAWMRSPLLNFLLCYVQQCCMFTYVAGRMLFASWVLDMIIAHQTPTLICWIGANELQSHYFNWLSIFNVNGITFLSTTTRQAPKRAETKKHRKLFRMTIDLDHWSHPQHSADHSMSHLSY
jgi:hypothetical protein